MDAKRWRRKIKKACENIGTYKDEFMPAIETLANLLESRDKVFDQYTKSGANPVVSYTNKAGATNLVKNPLMLSWLALNDQALTYWRDLGLTPKGYRTLSGEKVSKSDESGGLADIIASLER